MPSRSRKANRSSGVAGMGEWAHVSKFTAEKLRRCEPHGSLPPCGGGTGRGVATAHRARTCLQRAISRNQESWSGLLSGIGLETTAVLVVPPLPVPPPHGGRERCGTALPHFSRCIRVRVKTCVHALAPARARQWRGLAPNRHFATRAFCCGCKAPRLLA